MSAAPKSATAATAPPPPPPLVPPRLVSMETLRTPNRTERPNAAQTLSPPTSTRHVLRFVWSVMIVPYIAVRPLLHEEEGLYELACWGGGGAKERFKNRFSYALLTRVYVMLRMSEP